MRRGYEILILLFLISCLYSCEKEKLDSSSDSQLHFSTSVLNFDTLFTSIEPTTKNLRIRNSTNRDAVISSIKLAGGRKSSFKLNINGEAANETSNIEVPANDSIYIFVEAIRNKGGDIPLVNEDSIIFSYNDREQVVKLMAWERNFNLIKSLKIKTTTWTNNKPYLVYNYAYVDSGQVLTIEPGTKVYFHGKSGLYVKGTLNVKGNEEEPVEFRSDQINMPVNETEDRWNGIVLFSGSHNNKINHSIIRDANIGLQVGTIEHNGFASLALSNTRIENMLWSGIWAMKSKIVAFNNVISNVKYYNTALLLGGEYQFYHTTFANYFNDISSGTRKTETLVVSNYLVDNKSGAKYVGDLKGATFANCIITGNRVNELLISMDKRGSSNYLFERCLIQVSDTFKFDGQSHFREVLRNVNPRFINPYKGNFELDTLSIVKDFGKPSYSRLYPFDIKDEPRVLDEGPDLGAFERIENKGSK